MPVSSVPAAAPTPPEIPPDIPELEELADLARVLSRACVQSEEQTQRLLTFALRTAWESPAAEAFLDDLAGLQRRLGIAAESYAIAAARVRAHIAAVAEVKRALLHTSEPGRLA